MENDKKEKKALYKKKWVWFVIVLVVLVIIGGIFGGTAGNNSNTPTNNGSTTNNQTVEYKMNDTVTVGDLEYTINSAYNTDKIGVLGTVTQNNYVVITMTIKNDGSSEKYISESNFYYYRGNNKYGTHNDGIYLDNGFWLNETIGSGITKTINIVYEIPSAFESTDYIEVKDGFKNAKIHIR